MKSIIEQASSIMKAIEKAWDQAEKPKEFSIKIFEQEERNFFGMATKPAKIGIFFGDKPIVHEKNSIKPRQEIKQCRPETPEAKPKVTAVPVQQSLKEVTPSVQQPRTQAKVEKTPSVVTSSPVIEKAPRATTWNEAMVEAAHAWLKKTLSLMDMQSIDFRSEVAGKHLKITFNMPLVENVMQEKQLFRSFAHLIMSSLRNQYKQEMRDLKVILIRPE